MRKIFTDFPICGTFELSADDARHVVLVLRHTVGDTIPVTGRDRGPPMNASLPASRSFGLFDAG